MAYYYITVDVVMRDCEHAEDAVRQLSRLMPKYPDETTTRMESWSINRVGCETNTNVYHREDSAAETRLEHLVARAERHDQRRKELYE
jgi:outer membrane protein assembly factor BamD (BamD/ComL family)